MPLHKEYRKEKETQIQDFSLDEKLQALSNKDMYDLVQTLLNKNPQIRKSILEWFMDKSKDMENINRKQVSKALNDELLWEHWYDAKSIISQFNEYGGGPEDEEEEWQYFVKKLGEEPTKWRKERIMVIQKKYLKDDDAYLKMRKDDLHYGGDYWDLAEFYTGKGELKTAVEIAEEGLLKGDGRLTELFEFLSDHYAKSRDTANLERVVQYAIKKKSDEKEMLNRLFEYYKAENDYENAKRALLKAFEYVKAAGYIPEVRSYAHYNKMKQFLVEADWKNIEPKIIREVREKDPEDYLRICQDKNMKKEICKKHA